MVSVAIFAPYPFYPYPYPYYVYADPYVIYAPPTVVLQEAPAAEPAPIQREVIYPTGTVTA